MYKKLSNVQRKNCPNDEEFLKQNALVEKLKMEVSQEMGLKPKANNKNK